MDNFKTFYRHNIKQCFIHIRFSKQNSRKLQLKINKKLYKAESFKDLVFAEVMDLMQNV